LSRSADDTDAMRDICIGGFDNSGFFGVVTRCVTGPH
jgi:hypothetical protein